jgi:GTP-binding protein
MADIPGIIEGAAEGKGLGIRFLRHIERNSSLLFMIPCDTKSINEEYEILLHELRKYNPELLDKERVLAITKCDMMDDEMQKQMKSDLPKGIKAVFISSVSNKGITELKDLIWQSLHR